MPLQLSTNVHNSQMQQLLTLLTANSFQEGTVVLSSGKKSDFYIDCKQTSLCAKGHFLIGSLFCAIIVEKDPAVKAIGGLTLGADPLASATSCISFNTDNPLDAFLIRKTPKGHGTEEYLEGQHNLHPGMPVVILEDVVTTGASTIRAIERAKAANLDVRFALALVDRQEGGREAVEVHTPLYSLFTRQDFLQG